MNLVPPDVGHQASKPCGQVVDWSESHRRLPRLLLPLSLLLGASSPPPPRLPCCLSCAVALVATVASLASRWPRIGWPVGRSAAAAAVR